MAKVVIYSKEMCPYCVRAKNFLQEKGVDFQEVDLSNNLQELDRIKNETGWRTVPIIMINDQLIGGYTDLKALDEDGKLDSLLK